ncbi:NnrS family protein [Thauera sp. CAU 1555]|uniref:NnrS family protein n=1 Tax=Thauera sedimentorum TaxID=2767595 RepID=A0ABR9B597_9RHOO|nr:NnrS family protein [Thauera sedimentorum]MBC9070623.1 NnrS family protein [Thauera sedimentorum]MBD8501542.1 NnrS family protein [Thauera sedimentorum]
MAVSSPAAAGRPLFFAPHRAMFLSGGVMLLLVFLLWAVELGARAGLLPALGWALPPGWGHALLTVGGVFPFFIFGFLFTAMPRWQSMGDIAPQQWLGAWRILALGWAAVIPGLWFAPLLAAGLAGVLYGWARLAAVLWRVAFRSQPDPLHARATWLGVAGGGLSIFAWLVFALGGGAGWARVGIEAGVWWFLLPVFFSVCHRMVPFFSSNIIPDYVIVRPRWALLLMLGASFVHGALGMAELGGWRWVVDLPAGLVALWLCIRWRPVAAQRVRLLGMLHIGFAWLGVALLLSAAQAAGAQLGWYGLGLAPLHALGIGFFGSIVLGMVSRVTLGHSGQPLAADQLTWSLFLAMQGVVLLRILADLAPAVLSPWLMLAAVAGWLGIFVTWALRYLPIYLRPRADGRPG